jgi:hypothetical protein
MGGDTMDFGIAIANLKSGLKVARAGWNGKGMWLVLITRDDWTLSEKYGPLVDGLVGPPWIGMKTADNSFVPWLASQTDVLAEDWVIVE